MKTSFLFKGAVLASALAVAGQTVFAHSGATGVVKERMDGMGVMKGAMKTLTPMMRGQVEYDAAVVHNQARDISRHAGATLTKLFPEGSTDHPSEARLEIWQDWDAFSFLAEQLREAADGLAAASANGLSMVDAVPSAGAMMGTGMTGTASSLMMGTGSDSGRMDLSEMPADRVFAVMSQVCAACHTRFRQEK